MARNNHLQSDFTRLDKLLRKEALDTGDLSAAVDAYAYGRAMALVENVVAVVSDMAEGTSRIFGGGFSGVLGLDGYSEENSIWERRIISLMPEEEQHQKYIAELRFYHFLRQAGRGAENYYLMSRLRMTVPDGRNLEVLHRMYYLYGGDGRKVRYAVCLYGPMTVDFKGRSVVVNSITGVSEELTSSADANILSLREKQVLRLIDSGLKSRDIAEALHISVHTVSRHRQEILGKLQVKNSHEACRTARTLGLL